MAVCLSQLVLIFVLLVSHTASGGIIQHRYSERALFGNWPSIDNYRGAVLVKNGRQTSCEFALIDKGSAFIAASCLDLKAGTTTVATEEGGGGGGTRHEIYFEDSKYQRTASSSPIASTNIHVHPNYDATTYANNIAVVTFTTEQTRDWVNAISVNRDEWTNALYVRRYMGNVGSMSWRPPMVNSGAWGGFSGCAEASGIYSSNQRDFMCTTNSAPPQAMLLDSCGGLPFGSVYGIVTTNMASAALHSHSVVVKGDAMCGAPQQTFHYYTVLASYIGFAQKVLGHDVKYFTVSGDFSTGIDANYKMQPQAFGIPKGLRLFAGDVYVPGTGVIGTDDVLPPPPPPPASLPPVSPPSPVVPPPTTAPTTAVPDVPPPVPNNTPPAATSGGINTLISRPPVVNEGAGDRPQGVATDNSKPATANNEEEEALVVSSRSSRLPSASSRATTIAGGAVGNAGMLTVPHGQEGGIHDNGDGGGGGGGGAQTRADDDAAANNNASDDDNDGGGGGGLSGGQIVAIGILVPIAVIGMLVGAYYGMRWYRRRRLEKSWKVDEVRQIVDTQMTENELGLGANQAANYQLPSYRDYGGTMLIATSTVSSH